MSERQRLQMAAIASRIYSGAPDRQAMVDLLLVARPADRIADYPSIIDLHELLALRAVQENTRLWFGADGRLIGFALVDHYSNLCFESDRQAAPPELEHEMIDWGGEVLRRRMPGDGEPLTLDASCRDDDRGRIALLEQTGFLKQDMQTLHMARRLDEPIPTPQIPVGFSIRHVAGEHEAGALVALHRAAFGSESMTVEERLAMMRTPDYDPEMDLLAVAPDGTMAAYCMCSINRRENQRSGRKDGCTDPVATHPDFQHRGLARALLLTGLRALRGRGMERAVLGTSSANVAMQRAAQAAGFRIDSRTLWFAKPVPLQRGFQDDPDTIRWRLHLKSPIAKVFAMLSTQEGRESFWAESAAERNGVIHFVFPNGVTWDTEILQAIPPHTYAVRYYGNSEAVFELADDGNGGTDLTLTDANVPAQDRTEVIAGWVSVLMSLKAAVDFGVDLRGHDATRHWDSGYVEN